MAGGHNGYPVRLALHYPLVVTVVVNSLKTGANKCKVVSLVSSPGIHYLINDLSSLLVKVNRFEIVGH